MSEQRVRVAYFGYSAEFTTSENRADVIRSEANAIIISQFGQSPEMGYPETGVPFPSYVAVQYWDEEDGEFYPW